MEKARHFVLALLLLLSVFWDPQQAFAQTDTGQTSQALQQAASPVEESRPLLNALKRALPAPQPRPQIGKTSMPTQPGEVITFDPANQSTQRRPVPVSFANAIKQAPQLPSSLPMSMTGTAEILPNNLVQDHAPAAAGTTPAASALSAVTQPYSYPFNTIYKMLARFSASGSDYYYVCSAASASSFHLITAGHCVYNHDIENNGTNVAGWAQEVWVWAAQTDVVDPIGDPDFPYGVAKGVLYTTFTSFMNTSDFNWDFGFITLDRRMGDRTGWMGRDPGVPAASLNFSGYAVETPYVPYNTYFQYFGYDAGNVTGYSDYRIYLNAFVYGGHSGGPEWYYLSSDSSRWIQGVNSTSNRASYAEGTRYTSTIQNTLSTTISQDQSARPPVDRPELIEYAYDTTSKGLQTTSVTPGGKINVSCNAYNVGFAATNVYLDFYLSTNAIISTADDYIGWASLGTLEANSYFKGTCEVTIPSWAASGEYYVGWIFDPYVQEYNTDDNSVVITSQKLRVGPRSFSLYSPSNDGTGISLTPTLTWSTSSGATSYDVYFGTSSTTPVLATTVTGTSYAPGTLTAGTKYYWKVVAKNSFGNVSTGIWSFTTVAYPGAFSLTAPSNGATSVSATPTLSWGASSGATSYDVYFGTTSSPAIAQNVTTTSYAPGTLTPGTTYFWKVVAKNNAGTATAGPWSFTVAGGGPGAFSLSAPVNLATGISLTPALGWGASSGATSYDVYFGTGTSPAFARNVTTTTYSPGTLTAGTTYYWKVVAKNSGGTREAGPWSFKTSAPPQAGTITPASGSGMSTVFTATYTDADGGSNINDMRIRINAAASNTSACYVWYSVTNNRVYLTNDAGTGFLSGIAPGSASTVENSQCKLSGSGLSSTVTGNTRIVNVNLQFKTAFAGQKSVWLYAADGANLSSGWALKGTWAVAASSAPQAGTITPASGSGMSQAFTATYTDAEGGSNISDMRIRINAAASSASACYVWYSVTSNRIYLTNDAGTGFLSGIVPGSASTVENSQCTLSGSGSSSTINGNTRTFNANLQFKTAFAGQKSVWLYAADAASLNSGWALKGTWTVAASPTPQPVTITPGSGSGMSQVFTATYTDTEGGSSINDMRIRINAAASSASACYVWYSVTSNRVYLTNDAGTGFLSGIVPGSASTVENSQCTLSGSGSSSTINGNTRTFNADLQFKTAFAGQKSIWLYAADATSRNSGWALKGTWTVAAAPATPVTLSPANGATAVSVTPTLSWSAALGATSYDVYLGISPYPDLAGTTTGLTFNPGALRANTTYFWRVVAKSASGQASSATWRFTTARQAPGSIVNGGFETGTLSGWTAYGTATSTVNNAVPYGAVGYSLMQSAGNGGTYQVVSGLTPGATYTVNGMVCCSTDQAALYLEDGTGAGGVAYGWAMSPSWTPYSATFVATASGTMKIHLLRTGGTTPIYWDNVSLVWTANSPAGLLKAAQNQSFAGWTTYGPAAIDGLLNQLRSETPVAVSLRGEAGGAYRDFTGLVPGQAYRVSVRVEAGTGAVAQVGLWVHDSLGSNAVGTGWTPLVAGAKTGVMVDFTATEAGVARVYLNQVNAGSGSVKWSDISVEGAK